EMLNDKGDIHLNYPCVTPGAAIAKVRGRIVTSDKGVELKDFTQVHTMFEADGKYYQTEAQNATWNFRDPSPFIDTQDGKLYMVFEGNVAGERA
ncbi:glycoside hydrolase family 68 protein, partial [Pseudomonas syringae group genomosp. 7]|uniref:glycoside hydrolase family 68 protein n=1 Tax=Pseudomonas syringae group genomosp. 7 TaxID=251699 RepID=UPI00376FD1FE